MLRTQGHPCQILLLSPIRSPESGKNATFPTWELAACCHFRSGRREGCRLSNRNICGTTPAHISKSYNHTLICSHSIYRRLRSLFSCHLSPRQCRFSETESCCLAPTGQAAVVIVAFYWFFRMKHRPFSIKLAWSDTIYSL